MAKHSRSEFEYFVSASSQRKERNIMTLSFGRNFWVASVPASVPCHWHKQVAGVTRGKLSNKKAKTLSKRGYGKREIVGSKKCQHRHLPPYTAAGEPRAIDSTSLPPQASGAVVYADPPVRRDVLHRFDCGAGKKGVRRDEPHNLCKCDFDSSSGASGQAGASCRTEGDLLGGSG